jgi:hypothetical protein
MDGQVREMFQVDLGLDDEKATTRARGTEGGNEADEQSSAEQRRAAQSRTPFTVSLGFGEKATLTRATSRGPWQSEFGNGNLAVER